MNLLLLKLILTPTLIGAASVVGRKWGHSISGWLVALPLTTGPIVYVLALTHGTSFAADSAAGTLAGGFSLAAFVLVYARLAGRWTWPLVVTAASMAFGLTTSLLQGIQVPIFPLWAAVLAAFVIVMWLLPPDPHPLLPAENLAGRWDIPLRMAIATAFVLLITGLAPALGPHLTGLLSPFPLFTATLAAFAQHQHGPAASLKVLRGLLMGLFSYATFMFTLAMLLEPAGITMGFAAATIVLLAFQGAALWLLQRRSG